MSSRNNNRTTKLGSKPFCKVCHDAGKTEKEYTSHFVKSESGPNGKVVCPTLLAQQCRYCFNNGHTAGYCPTIAANKKAEEKALKLSAQREAFEKNQGSKPVAVKKNVNVFAALDESSDTEEKVSKKVTKTTTIVASNNNKPVAKKEEEFPALPSSKPTKTSTAAPLMTGYASVAAKTPQEYETKKYEQQIILNSMKRQLPPMKNETIKHLDESNHYESDEDSWSDAANVAIAVAPTKPKMLASMIDWTALDSDDSDDEDW